MRERFLIGQLIVPSFFVSCNKEKNTIINTQKSHNLLVAGGVVCVENGKGLEWLSNEKDNFVGSIFTISKNTSTRLL